MHSNACVAIAYDDNFSKSVSLNFPALTVRRKAVTHTYKDHICTQLINKVIGFHFYPSITPEDICSEPLIGDNEGSSDASFKIAVGVVSTQMFISSCCRNCVSKISIVILKKKKKNID